jgi:RNA polymerase sigma-70 factor (ECF subfamily)
MSERDPLMDELEGARKRFLALVADVRPELHRYCARMTGSVADGEDIVQDTLARAYYCLPELESLPPLRAWLFRIAQNRALDWLRRYDKRMGEPLEGVVEVVDDEPDPEDTVARDEAVRAAIGRFVELAPAQRSAVILKDVLGHSLAEIAELLELTVPAVKAALHRGRVRLREQARTQSPRPDAPSPTLVRYVGLFTARDWDGVRALLAEDVRLDLVSQWQRAGRREVGSYFTNYASLHDWRLAAAWLDGREVVAVFRGGPRPAYFVELDAHAGRITSSSHLNQNATSRCIDEWQRWRFSTGNRCVDGVE